MRAIRNSGRKAQPSAQLQASLPHWYAAELSLRRARPRERRETADAGRPSVDLDAGRTGSLRRATGLARNRPFPARVLGSGRPDLNRGRPLASTRKLCRAVVGRVALVPAFERGAVWNVSRRQRSYCGAGDDLRASPEAASGKPRARLRSRAVHGNGRRSGAESCAVLLGLRAPAAVRGAEAHRRYAFTSAPGLPQLLFHRRYRATCGAGKDPVRPRVEDPIAR